MSATIGVNTASKPWVGDVNAVSTRSFDTREMNVLEALAEGIASPTTPH